MGYQRLHLHGACFQHRNGRIERVVDRHRAEDRQVFVVDLEGADRDTAVGRAHAEDHHLAHGTHVVEAVLQHCRHTRHVYNDVETHRGQFAQLPGLLISCLYSGRGAQLAGHVEPRLVQVGHNDLRSVAMAEHLRPEHADRTSAEEKHAVARLCL